MGGYFFALFSTSLPSEYPALKQVAPKLKIASTIPMISIWHPSSQVDSLAGIYVIRGYAAL